MNEKQIQTDCHLAVGSLSNVTLFRNNVGTGVSGSNITNIRKPTMIILMPGDIVIRNGRRVNFGLCKGSSDLIGFKTVIITPEMIGMPFAQFVGMEVKTPKGRASADQLNFMEAVRRAGGLAGIVRNADDALTLIGKS